MKSSTTMTLVPFTPMVKVLVIVTTICWFVLQIILEGLVKVPVLPWLGLIPAQVFFEGYVWQIFSYMFLHSLQIFHILLNMLMLWFFGAELELRWGSRYFLFYYLFCGVGAAIIYCAGLAAYSLVTGAQSPLLVPVVGASGAIFGLMLAHGILFAERVVYFLMLFPMKTKYFVGLMALIQIASMVSSSLVGSEVAYLAHLGGFIAGYLALWSKGRWERLGLRKKIVHRKRNLRLVKDEDSYSSKEPRYWN